MVPTSVLPPAIPSTLQDTAVLVVFVNVAANCCGSLVVTPARRGDTVTAIFAIAPPPPPPQAARTTVAESAASPRVHARMREPKAARARRCPPLWLVLTSASRIVPFPLNPV